MKSIVATSDKLELKLVEADIPQIGEGEVLVKVLSSTIHPSDISKGKGEFLPIEYPHQMGIEGYGEIVDSNNQMKGKYCGFWSVTASAWSEYTKVKINDLIIAPKFDKKDLGKAANFYLNPITALGLLDLIKTNKQSAVAFNAGFSQVSQMLIKLCRQNNIKTLAIVRKEEQIEKCKELGCDIVLNLNNTNFLDQFKQGLNELNITMFLDSVGKESEAYLEYLPIKTNVYYYGYLSGNLSKEFKKGLSDKKNIKFEFFYFASFYNTKSLDQKEELATKITQELDTTFSTNINKHVKLEDVPKAFNEYFEDMAKGKIIIDVCDCFDKEMVV